MVERSSAEKNSPPKLLRWLLVLFAACLFFLAFIFWRNAEHYRVSSRSSIFSVTALFTEWFLPSPAYAAERVPRFADGMTYYESGELVYGEARDLYRLRPDPKLETFQDLAAKAIEEYRFAITAWSLLYDAIPTDDPKRGIERARLLDAVNHALWRMVPFVSDEEREKVRTAIEQNYRDAFAAIAEYRGTLPSGTGESAMVRQVREKIEKSYEFFRRRDNEEEKQRREQQGVPKPKKSEQQMHFPGEGQSQSLGQKKQEIEQKRKQLAKDQGQGEGKAEQPERKPGERPGESPGKGTSLGPEKGVLPTDRIPVPGLGQMPFAVVKP